MYYERKIKYLDYYEEGEKLRSGGFVKLEIKENQIRLEISVKGLYPTDSFVRDVILRSGGTEAALGQITIRDGCGSFEYICNVDKEMGHTKIAYAALREIRIPIGGTRELVCPLAEAARSYRDQVPVSRKEAPAVPVAEAVEVQETAEVTKAAREVETIEESVETKGTAEKVRVETWKIPEIHKPSVEDLQQYEEASDAGQSQQQENASDTRQSQQQESVSDTRQSQQQESVSDTRQSQQQENASETRQSLQHPQQREDASAPHTLQSEVHLASAEPDMQQGSRQEGNQSVKKGRTAPRLLEDKWQQLSAIYPHIQPFQDERDYLSINPSDFVLFPSKFYKAVNNSFLLHGYYNYNHLILARMEHRGEVLYYIGVPGNYYDREKQVAVMFGFESFECAAEPAKTGDFGYYMMRMEL